jgi:carbonic anhydrase
MNGNWTRRNVLRSAVGLAAGAAALGGASAWSENKWADNPKPSGGAPQNAVSPAAALKRLMDGNARYAKNQPNVKDYSAGRAERAEAQYPVAAVLSCADSRVSPEFVFDQAPGDVFVTRVAGNYMSPDILASLEYSVEVLGAPLIVVLGHTNCGAVSAVVKNAKKGEALPGHIFLLVDALHPGVEQALKEGGSDVLEHAIEANVKHNVSRLKRAQPILARQIAAGKLDVVGGVYDLPTGQVKLL